MTMLSIVAPCYNEQDVLPETSARLLALLDLMIGSGKISHNSRLYFVDDGSQDGTWPIIEKLAATGNNVHGIKLSRNCGHQNALLAGLLYAKGDVVISLDVDLQDDIDIINTMVDVHNQGNDIVYGVRKNRSSDGFLKRLSAEMYYKFLKAMGVDIIFNHADFRLMSRRALDALKKYNEVNLFLRGIIPTIGFQSSIVEYDRLERFAGESKYPFRKMMALAVNGVTSFSSKPLRMIAVLGMIIFLVSVFLSLWVVWVKFMSTDAVPGWASSVLPMYFLGGIQLLSIGILGEYVAKIYMETKRRPRFIVEKTASDSLEIDDSNGLD